MANANSFRKFNRRIILGFFLAFFFAGSSASIAQSPTWYGYVVGEDRRIYMVNLEAGGLEWVSRVLVEAGAFDIGSIDISDVEINAEESILYVSSEDYIGRTDYAPLLAVKLNATADPVFQLAMDHPSGLVGNSHSVIFNPGANDLYVGFYLTEPRALILDPVTGEVIGSMDTMILEQEWFSADGASVFGFVPGSIGEWDGEPVERPAEVVVRDVETGEVVSSIDLESNPGQLPPAAGHGGLIVRYRGPYRDPTIEVFDKTDGRLLNSFGILETFGANSTQFHVTDMPGTGNVAMSIGSDVVVFDPLTTEVKSRTYIGDMFLSEVVVSEKPVILSER